MSDILERYYAHQRHSSTERPSVHECIEQIEHLRSWVTDLQSGLYVNCVYCGHRYGPGETTPVSMADALKAHVAECPKHPMSGLVEALSELLTLHGTPHREEWMNDAAFKHAQGVHARASAAMAKVKP